jgi:hypothetical protein
VAQAEHRKVMERKLGRALFSFETVHHRNGIRTDNDPDNLELWTKHQPSGQRVSDLVDFIARHYWDEVCTARGRIESAQEA